MQEKSWGDENMGKKNSLKILEEEAKVIRFKGKSPKKILEKLARESKSYEEFIKKVRELVKGTKIVERDGQLWSTVDIKDLDTHIKVEAPFLPRSEEEDKKLTDDLARYLKKVYEKTKRMNATVSSTKKKGRKRRKVAPSRQERRSRILLDQKTRENLKKWRDLLTLHIDKSAKFLEKLSKQIDKNNPLTYLENEIKQNKEIIEAEWFRIRNNKEMRKLLYNLLRERYGLSLKEVKRNPSNLYRIDTDLIKRKYSADLSEAIKLIQELTQTNEKLSKIREETKEAINLIKKLAKSHRSLADRTFTSRKKIIQRHLGIKVKTRKRL